jgi:crossover junction endodeoxyribonuclease RusA
VSAVAINPFADPRHLDVFVTGDPAPQGSKRHVGNGVMVESSKRLRPWRQDVREALLDENGSPRLALAGPVSVGLMFTLRRPKKPRFHVPGVVPDLDKLVRAVLDALTSAGVVEDDARVVHLGASKVYATAGQACGVRISVRCWNPEES